jgi:hypothetical protein
MSDSFSRRQLLAALAGLGAASCGYALVGHGITTDPTIKKIGVPLFKDTTGKPGLDQKVTQKVIEELLKRGRFQVLQQAEGVDARVDGEILSYRSQPVGFSDQGVNSGATAVPNGTTEATRYAITLTAKVTYGKVGEKEPIWQSDGFQYRDEYDVGSDPATYFDREEQSIDRLVTNFARNLVSTMLEAF